MSFDSTLFFSRAREEAGRYGEDPWVFLRELVQNSRDANATRVDFTVAADGKWQTITCRDDGEGMSRLIIEAYLLRLYASNKEDLASAIGLFGVGFWSVLLFQPDVIRVNSFDGRSWHALEIDCLAHEVRSVSPGTRTGRGTEIVLRRATAGQPQDDGRLTALVEEKLALFAGHIRPAPGVKQLDIYCQGRRLNRSFEPPAVFGKRFRAREFEGVLGFDTAPSVRIYKGGILVRDLAGLEEVIPSRRRVRLPESGWGLHPVIRLNADGLKVLMDRQTIFEDPVLHRAVDYCEKELLKLHRRLIRRLFPMDARNRLAAFRLALRGRLLPVLAGFVLVLALGVAGILLWRPEYLSFRSTGGAPPAASPTATEALPLKRLTVDRALRNWDGMFINEPGGERAVWWDFRYEGGGERLFRLRAFGEYDPQVGLRPVPLEEEGTYSTVPERPGAIRITIGVSGAGDPFVLPCPPGYALVEGSLARNDGRPPPAVRRNSAGEPVTRARASGRLRYTVAPAFPTQAPLAITAGAPQPSWPPEWWDFVVRIRGLPPEERVNRAMDHVRRHFVYARDESLSHRFDRYSGTWLERVIRLGAGDCDVLNGVLVLLLRSVDIPARLEAGLVGTNGRAGSTLHAWARCYVGGWRTVDVSTGYNSSANGSAFPVDRVLGEAALPGDDGDTGRGAGGRMPESAGPGETHAATPGHGYGLAGGALILVTVLCLAVWWRRRRRPPVDQPQYIRELFRHHLTYGHSDGTLKLHFRPIFPTLGGGCLSLHQLQALAGEARLIGAEPGCPLAARLRGRRSFLDATAEIVRELTPFLPPVTWLDQWQALLKETDLTPAWRQVQSLLGRLEPDIRLYRVRGESCFAEAHLPFRDSGRGRFHVRVGDTHPLWTWAEEEIAANGPAGLFSVLEKLTGMMTLAPARRYRLLAAVADEIRETPARGSTHAAPAGKERSP
jgi:transglutaminase-like putative cysteine protease